MIFPLSKSDPTPSCLKLGNYIFMLRQKKLQNFKGLGIFAGYSSSLPAFPFHDKWNVKVMAQYIEKLSK